jgi:hypothetical protein
MAVNCTLYKLIVQNHQHVWKNVSTASSGKGSIHNHAERKVLQFGFPKDSSHFLMVLNAFPCKGTSAADSCHLYLARESANRSIVARIDYDKGGYSGNTNAAPESAYEAPPCLYVYRNGAYVGYFTKGETLPANTLPNLAAATAVWTQPLAQED